MASQKPSSDDDAFMRLALDEARLARAEDDVPIGAVVVLDGRVVGRGHNRTRAERDPTAHAEMIALREATRTTGYQRLDGCTVYTTVEPCFMCAGALVHARVARVVWGVRDPKFGGAASLGNVLDDPRLNHRAETAEGVCAEECRTLLVDFFREKRGARSATSEEGASDDAPGDDPPVGTPS
ncbi:MAG: tRNA adenosine(34) deaminase TadA [Planctomycetota bacterium]